MENMTYETCRPLQNSSYQDGTGTGYTFTGCPISFVIKIGNDKLQESLFWDNLCKLMLHVRIFHQNKPIQLLRLKINFSLNLELEILDMRSFNHDIICISTLSTYKYFTFHVGLLPKPMKSRHFFAIVQ